MYINTNRHNGNSTVCHPQLFFLWLFSKFQHLQRLKIKPQIPYQTFMVDSANPAWARQRRHYRYTIIAIEGKKLFKLFEWNLLPICNSLTGYSLKWRSLYQERAVFGKMKMDPAKQAQTQNAGEVSSLQWFFSQSVGLMTDEVWLHCIRPMLMK